jgi:hypothetical protein
VAYTLLWGACLHEDEADQQRSLARAAEAYRGAAKFAGGADELQPALVELKAEIDSWSRSKRDHYRDKSQEWHLRNYEAE